MKEELEKLDSAYKWLDSLSVSGANIDRLAMARQELRGLYQMLKEKEKGNG